MTYVNTYITFNGNCREAMNFYQECLGGELFFQTVGESPMADKIPLKMRESILHSNLTSGDVRIQASDMGDEGLIKGNNVSLMLNCRSEEEIRTTYEKLASGGIASHPLEDTFWSSLFGGLTDKFKIRWMLHFPKN